MKTMKQGLRDFGSALALIGAFLGLSAALRAETATGPNSPGIYNTVSDTKTLQRINTLYRSGKITFSQYQAYFAALEHSAQLHAGKDASPSADVIAMAADQAAPVSSPVGLGSSPQRSARMPLTDVPLFSSIASQGSPVKAKASLVEVPISQFYFQPLFSHVKILIKDYDFNLTPAEKTQLNVLLASLPESMLAGLNEIDIVRQEGTFGLAPVLNGSKLTIYASQAASQPQPQTGGGVLKVLPGIPLSSALLQGIGDYVWQSALSQQQREDFTGIFSNLSGLTPVDAQAIFSAFFADYHGDSAGQLLVSAQYVVGSPNNGQGDPQQMLSYLSIASLFAHSNKVISQYDFNGTLNYQPAYKDSNYLTVGGLHFLLKNNQIIGYTTNDVYPPNDGKPHTVLATVWDPPLTLGNSFLNLFANK